jgi:hypothetical protein
MNLSFSVKLPQRIANGDKAISNSKFEIAEWQLIFAVPLILSLPNLQPAIGNRQFQ